MPGTPGDAISGFKRIGHDLRVNNGGTITMPQFILGEDGWGNLKIPSMSKIYGGDGSTYDAIDTTQGYPAGTKFEIGERVFRYAKFGDDDAGAVWGAGTGQQLDHATLIGSTALEVSTVMRTTAANVAEVLITEALVTANQYAGGWLIVQNGSKTWAALILGNTASDASDYVTLYMEAATPEELTSSYTTMLTKYAWHGVVRHSGAAANMGYQILGVWPGFRRAADTEGYWGWIQTWGPCFGVIATSHQGDAHAERMLVAKNGAMQCEASTQNQIIGYYMQEYDASTLAYPLVFLTCGR